MCVCVCVIHDDGGSYVMMLYDNTIGFLVFQFSSGNRSNSFLLNEHALCDIEHAPVEHLVRRYSTTFPVVVLLL